MCQIIDMKKIPLNCPSCENTLEVTELSCNECDTRISGKFSLPSLLQLPPDELEFILQFVITSGSLKKMALEMEKSYPTVRNKLDDVIEKLVLIKNQ